MPPESNHSQQAAPANLPTVSGIGEPGAAAVPIAAAVPATPASSQSGSAAAQAQQLVAQYAHDPYKLNEALVQLKMSYLAQQYHVNPSGADH